jgi:hypothetical protein
MAMDMEQSMDQIDLQVCATHTAQLSSISEDVKEIKGDIKTVLPIVAVHAKVLGSLETRMDRVEGQLNWGKWILAIVAGTTALVTFLQQTAQSWVR